ncbi:hypothetical protein [Actinomadura decatromicini]|uniref:Minor tail protein n=1 Tax=Actinomadura decatromicini TaxID=2604572 RepID=A0A5D3FAP4_9ACTN|nr:hypothetical protein [Actinomadura decatromicini]TYK45149.1 hypothetical protein FXF68_31200 [Actinomadura decatromicini]
MAEASWPVSTYNGGAVTEAEFEQEAAHFTEDGWYMDPNGVYLDTAGGPVYADSSGMTVKVRADKYASVRGFAYHSGGTDVSLSITPNSSGATRYDRVVLELDRSTWEVRAAIVEGSPGAGVPPVTRDEGTTGVWQMPSSVVTVGSGAATINAGDVYTDGHRVGSRVRAWLKAADMLYPKLGEIGFDATARGWFGWDGTARRTLYSNSGTVALSLTSGWAADGANSGRCLNGWVEITMNLRRTGSAVPEGGSTVITTLPTSLRPVDQHKYCFVHVTGDNNGRMDFETNGTVNLRHLWQGVGTGEYIRFTFTYLRGGD